MRDAEHYWEQLFEAEVIKAACMSAIGSDSGQKFDKIRDSYHQGFFQGFLEGEKTIPETVMGAYNRLEIEQRLTMDIKKYAEHIGFAVGFLTRVYSKHKNLKEKGYYQKLISWAVSTNNPHANFLRQVLAKSANF